MITAHSYRINIYFILEWPNLYYFYPHSWEACSSHTASHLAFIKDTIHWCLLLRFILFSRIWRKINKFDISSVSCSSRQQLIFARLKFSSTRLDTSITPVDSPLTHNRILSSTHWNVFSHPALTFWASTVCPMSHAIIKQFSLNSRKFWISDSMLRTSSRKTSNISEMFRWEEAFGDTDCVSLRWSW